MRTDIFPIWEPTEYMYEAYGFLPTLTTYIHEAEEVRPGLIIVPGGGYEIVSPSEGEIVARRFYNLGYQTFVLTYTIMTEKDKPLRMQPMLDLARAVSLVRSRMSAYKVKANALGVCGFSAGGHLCGSLCVHFSDPALSVSVVDEQSVRPDFQILCYPVISSSRFAHEGSFRALCGCDELLREYMSLEEQVIEDTPPVFLWHTMTDAGVPVDNSILYGNACRSRGVPVEMHLFGKGRHGLSLADEEWERGIFKGLEVAQQHMVLKEQYRAQSRKLSAHLSGYIEYIEGLRRGENLMAGLNTRNEERSETITMWPILADKWVRLITHCGPNQ